MANRLAASGRRKTLNQRSGMPNVQGALSNWFSPLTIVKITQVNTDGDITRMQIPITFKGVVQPLKPEAIALKAEGQRSFQWLQIHAIAGQLNLKTTDRIRFNRNTFKVMDILDYTQNGYIEYHCVYDFQDGS